MSSILSMLYALFESWTSIGVFFLALSAASLIASCIMKRKPSNYPPGPWLNNLPVVGYIPLVGRMPHLALQRLSDKYGPVVSVELGQVPAVVLNDFESIRQVLVEQGDALTGRPHDALTREFSLDYHGLAFSEGELWREQRRFALMTMRNLGMGKSQLQDLILQQVDVITQRLERDAGKKPLNPRKLLAQMAGGVICLFIFGRPADFDGDDFEQIMLAFQNSDVVSPINYMQAFPLLLEYGPMRWFMDYAWNEFQGVINALNKMIQIDLKNATTNDSSEDSSSLMQAFIKKQNAERASGAHIPPLQDVAALLLAARKGHFEARTHSTFTNIQLIAVVFDMFIAGIETSASTLSWAINFMLHFPLVAQRCQEEIDRVVGRDRKVTMDDRATLPFVEATLYEVMRIRAIAPLGVFHRTTAPVKAGSFSIPADTVVIANIYASLMDRQQWERPDEFNPALHFLDGQGVHVRVPKAFMPFSAGKRSCLGESIARMELFIFFANLLQRFNLKAAGKMPSLMPDKVNFLMKSPDYEITVTAR